MGMDFKIICEYKINNKWNLLKEDLGNDLGEIIDTRDDYYKSGDIFWISKYWTGSILRTLLSGCNNIVKACEDSYNALDYLSSTFYEIDDYNIYGITEYYDREEIFYCCEIIYSFQSVKDIVKEKYKAEEVRLLYMWY